MGWDGVLLFVLGWYPLWEKKSNFFFLSACSNPPQTLKEIYYCISLLHNPGDQKKNHTTYNKRKQSLLFLRLGCRRGGSRRDKPGSAHLSDGTKEMRHEFLGKAFPSWTLPALRYPEKIWPESPRLPGHRLSHWTVTRWGKIFWQRLLFCILQMRNNHVSVVSFGPSSHLLFGDSRRI